MLGRYRIVRGKRPPQEPLPEGRRQDTRKHTKHCLRPDAQRVLNYLAAPSQAGWEEFAKDYRQMLGQRYRADPAPFAAIAELARIEDVWLGCSCPTTKNPDVRRCHTYLALEFMAESFSDLEIEWPEVD